MDRNFPMRQRSGKLTRALRGYGLVLSAYFSGAISSARPNFMTLLPTFSPAVAAKPSSPIAHSIANKATRLAHPRMAPLPVVSSARPWSCADYSVIFTNLPLTRRNLSPRQRTVFPKRLPAHTKTPSKSRKGINQSEETIFGS
jgi:hypothetical protein